MSNVTIFTRRGLPLHTITRKYGSHTAPVLLDIVRAPTTMLRRVLQSPCTFKCQSPRASCSCISIENLRSHGTGDRDLVSHSSAKPSASRAIYHQWRQRGLLGESVYKFRHQSPLILATAPSHYTSLPFSCIQSFSYFVRFCGQHIDSTFRITYPHRVTVSARFVSVQFRLNHGYGPALR